MTTIDSMIRDAGWFKGTDRDWQALPIEERDRLAFAATGCQVAYATWPSPVECLHTKCRIARGELEPIALTESILAGERESGWLRFMDEAAYTRLHTAMIDKAHETGVYDPWAIGWQAIVLGGILA